MKTINATVLPNHFDARLLADRRDYPTLDTALLKRHSRRQERLHAKNGLRNDMVGIMGEFVKDRHVVSPTQPARVPALAPVNTATAKTTFVPPVVIPFPTRAVTVIRKRPFQRMSVETLLLAA
jgi:hypothetical protein